MPLASYVFPLAAAGCLMALSHLLGSMHCCWLLVVPVCVVLHVAALHLWHGWERKRLEAVAKEHTAMGKQLVDLWPDDLADLPAWVRFPDTERVEWLNKVVRQLWPYAGEYARTYMKNELQPMIAANLPGPLKAFRFESVDVGRQPCRVGGIKVYKDNVGRDQVLLDMDVAYAGDCHFSVALDLAAKGRPIVTLSGGVTDVLLTGRIRAMLAPLIAQPPLVAAVRVFFLERPSLDFRLTGLGELAEFPGLMNAVRTVVNQQMAGICIIPNAICVPLVPGATDLSQLILPEPQGVLRVNVAEARQLENKDISFLRKGRSDPYAVLTLGTQTFKTKVIQDNLHPVWNENFELCVHAVGDQQLRIELFDEDAGKDEELGRLTLDVARIRDKCLAASAGAMQQLNTAKSEEDRVPAASVDDWHELEACQTGELKLRLQWLVLSAQPDDLKQAPGKDAAWLRGSRTMHDAVLLVYVDNVADLPQVVDGKRRLMAINRQYPKVNLSPSPALELSLGGETRRTLPKWSTSNPAWQEKFVFFVSQPETQQLHVRAVDESSKRSLGACAVPLRRLLAEPGLELRQHTFPLALGTHTAPLVMTVRLRPLTGMRKSDLMHALVGANGTPVQQPVHLADGGTSSGTTTSLPPVVGGKPPLPDGRPSSPLSLIIDTPSQRRRLDDNNMSPNAHGDTASVGGPGHRRPSFLRRLRSKSKRRSGSAASLLRPGHCGHIQIALQYHADSAQLVVIIHRAENLVSVSASGGADPYCQLKLLASSHGSARHKHRTNMLGADLNPVWDESFVFGLAANALRVASLRVTVKDGGNFGVFARPPALGAVQLNLADHDLINGPMEAQWFDLMPPSILE